MKFICSLILVLVCQYSFAKTYYINPKGNDNTGNGSIGSPWQTLFRATTSVRKAGDIIHMMAGVYLETVQSELAVGVSLEGDGQNSTVLKSALTSDWKALLTAGSDMEGVLGNQHISNIKFDGQNMATAWGILITGRSNFSIYNCTFVDFRNRGVTFSGRVDNESAAPGIYAKDNSFHDNIMSNCAEYVYGNYGSGCLILGGQQNMLIYNNSISQNSRAEGHNGWPIKYTNDGYLKGCKIYNNKLTKIPMGNDPGINGWDFAIELFNASGLEIYGNTIQGSIDLNVVTRDTFDFGVWIHDNKIGQLVLNKFVETGITLEYHVESVLIENNELTNLGIPIYFTPREGNIINDVIIRHNICNNIGVANGSHQGLGIRLGEDGGRTYFLKDFLVYDNKFIGSEGEKPYWGIAITGISKANNIQIKQNTIKNFSAGSITANPGSAIDSMIVEGNNLINNGYGNKTAFYGGSPLHYIDKKNNSENASVFSYVNFKMNVIRPLYYELKKSDMLILITAFTFIIGMLFTIKEHVYSFPIFVIYTVINIFLGLEKELIGEAAIFLVFTIASIYGWVMWSKRNQRNHRKIRVSTSSPKEKLLQLVFFTIAFGLIFTALFTYKDGFAPGSIPWADALATATAFTGIWLVTRKKAESWYWWMATSLISVPLYYFKHQIVISIFYTILLIITIWGSVEWKKAINKKRSQSLKKVKYS